MEDFCPDRLRCELLPDVYEERNPVLIKRVIEDIGRGSFGFVFTGFPGTGKTYLAELILAWLDSREQSLLKGRKIVAQELYADYLRIMESKCSDKSEAISKRQHAFRGNVALLDDLGAEPDTPASRKFMRLLIDDRYRLMEKYWR